MKHYRRIIPMAVLIVLVTGLTACASTTSSQRTPIRPVGNCLDVRTSPEMYTPDNKTVIAKSGPNYFRIDLVNNCGMFNAATLQLKVADDKRSMQRMCGELGDEIINSDGLHCRVKDVTIIDKQEFNTLQAQSKARR